METTHMYTIHKKLLGRSEFHYIPEDAKLFDKVWLDFIWKDFHHKCKEMNFAVSSDILTHFDIELCLFLLFTEMLFVKV